jgi:DNA mismatch endonuclease, patch repair protein
MTSLDIHTRMANVRLKDTDIEIILRSALHKRGLRFRKNLRGIPGSPDIVFTKRKLVVFVDGDFWHGWRFEEKKDKLKPFWRAKVEANIARDLRNNADLENSGWKVLRFWEHDIKKNLEVVVATILAAVKPPST